jgi:hypothetical protein
MCWRVEEKMLNEIERMRGVRGKRQILSRNILFFIYEI